MKRFKILLLAIFTLLSATTAYSAGVVVYPKFSAMDDSGNPLTGGCLYSYDCGTTDKAATCADNTCSADNPNPITLDSRGEEDVYADQCFKFALYEADTDGVCDSTPSTSLIWTKDNIPFVDFLDEDNFVSDSASAAASQQSINAGKIHKVISLAALKALVSTPNLDTAYVQGRTSTGDGYQGVFHRTTNDISTQVALDIFNGIYVPFDSDITGGAGGWIRQSSILKTVNPRWFGIIPDGDLAGNGTDWAEELQSIYDLGYRYVNMGPGIFVIGTRIDLPIGSALIGSGIGRTIFDANIGTTASFGLTANCKIQGFTVDSSFFPSTAITDTTNYSLSSRRIDLLSGCVVRDIEIKNAGSGLNMGSSANNCRIYNYIFSSIRERNGQGAGFHVTGSNDIRVYGIFGSDSDRACEIEDGATDCSLIGGKMSAIYPNGYGGQPGGYSTTSFVLNAHSHEGTGGVKNISYRDFILDDCALSIDSQRSSGTNVADMPQNCTWENIRIISPRTNALIPHPIYIEGINCRIANVIVEGTALTSGEALIKVFGSDSRGNIFENIEIGQKYKGTAVLVEAPHTTLRNISLEDQTATVQVEDLIYVDAPFVTVEKCIFTTPESARTFIRYVNGADWGLVKNNQFNLNGISVDTTVASIQIESEITSVIDNTWDGVGAVAIKLSAAGAFDGGVRCRISNNMLDHSTGAVPLVVLDVNTQRNLVTGNILQSNTQTITDAGTDNTVINNKKGDTAIPQTYTPANVSTDRAFDADTVAIAELADVVGTLIDDLQDFELLK